MLDKLKWCVRLLRSDSFMVIDDNGAVVHIPVNAVNTIKNRVILASQHASLQDFKTKLEDVITQHEEAIKRLDGKVVKKTPKSNARVQTRSRGKKS